jgi:hypothetical protein
MGLGRQIVDFIRLHLLNDVDETGRIGHIAVMEDKVPACFVGILIEVINASCIKKGAATLDAMHLIPLSKQ